MPVPTPQELMNPLLTAFRSEQGALQVSKLESLTAKICNLSDDDLREMQTETRSKFNYRLAWARNYLKRLGYIRLAGKGLWELTEFGRGEGCIDERIVNNIYRALESAESVATGIEEDIPDSRVSEDIIDPFDPNLIRVESKPVTLGQLISRIHHKEIDLAPAFQRKAGIWHEQAQSRLIESILVRIPIPAFYFDATNEDRWVVVDGLQRLTALKKFVLDKSLKLNGLEFLDQSLGGLSFDQLPRTFQRRLDETNVTIFLIANGTPPTVKFNIFKRINTGGLPLSTQEIRHALNQGKITILLENLAKGSLFKTATWNSIKDDRMADRECVLRFLAFSLSSPAEYRASDFDGFLSDKMAELNELPDSEIEILAASFQKAMSASYSIFGRDAFRKPIGYFRRRMPLNKALFEAWSVNLGSLTDDELKLLCDRKMRIVEEHEALYDPFDGDASFVASISQGTGDPKKVRKRFEAVKGIIAKNLV